MLKHNFARTMGTPLLALTMLGGSFTNATADSELISTTQPRTEQRQLDTNQLRQLTIIKNIGTAETEASADAFVTKMTEKFEEVVNETDKEFNATPLVQGQSTEPYGDLVFYGFDQEIFRISAQQFAAVKAKEGALEQLIKGIYIKHHKKGAESTRNEIVQVDKELEDLYAQKNELEIK